AVWVADARQDRAGGAAVHDRDAVVVRVSPLPVRVVGAGPGRAPRARGRGRQEGAVHAVRGHGDPLAGQRVAPHLRSGDGQRGPVRLGNGGEAGRQRARVVEAAGRGSGEVRLGVVEVDQLPAVGEGGGGAAHGAPIRAGRRA